MMKRHFLKIPLYRLAKDYKKIPKDRKVVVFDYRGCRQLWRHDFSGTMATMTYEGSDEIQTHIGTHYAARSCP